jgi:hypothetical protein
MEHTKRAFRVSTSEATEREISKHKARIKRHPERHSKSNQKKMLWEKQEDKKDLKPLKVIKVYDFLLESNREKFFLLFFLFFVLPLTVI